MFSKGQKKVPGSGRKKGVKNKRHMPDVVEHLIARGINPVQKLLDLSRSKRLSAEHELQLWKTLLSYCHRKPQAEGTPPPPGDDPYAGLPQDDGSVSDDELLRMSASVKAN